MKAILPDELRQAIEENGPPVEVSDEQTNRVFYLISAEQYEILRRLLEPEAFDPSFFEAENIERFLDDPAEA